MLIVKPTNSTESMKKYYGDFFIDIRASFAKKIIKNDSAPNEVVPNLFIGSVGAAFSRSVLKEKGITHILCVADNIKPAYPQVRLVLSSAEITNIQDFTYKTISVFDRPHEDIKQYFNECGEFIRTALVDEKNKVLVHWYYYRQVSKNNSLWFLVLVESRDQRPSSARNFSL